MKEKITKTFRRVIKTADYETVEVLSSVEKEVEYSTDAERATQITKLRDDATNQLVDDITMICDKLGVSEKRIHVKSNRPMPAALRSTDI